jgi:holo-[acyl-carrier protein] synthase
MSVGIGVDLVSIERIEGVWRRSGDRFLRKILTLDEQNAFALIEDPSRQINFLAKRFAAKEAVVKSLGTGFANGVSWQNISIEYSSAGQPGIELEGRALTQMQQLGGSRVLLSLSDEAGMVVAFAQVV